MGLLSFVETFKTDKDCENYLIEHTFRNEIKCSCGCSTLYKLNTKTKYQIFKCSQCKTRFSIIKNTIFEGSNIGLRKWFLAIHLLTSSSKGISSVQLSKQLKVTQKTAWFMLQRLRESMKEGFSILKGQVEIDETYVGGKEKNKHSNKKIPNSLGGANKEVVFGAVERGETKKVKAIHLEDNKPRTINKAMLRTIEKNSELLTDESNAYLPLKGYYDIYSCNHSQKKYVIDEIIYNNNVENFWSIFKRGYVGVYHYMSKKHLQRYLNEYTFRYNNKNTDLLPNMLSLSKVNKMTYKELIRG